VRAGGLQAPVDVTLRNEGSRVGGRRWVSRAPVARGVPQPLARALAEQPLQVGPSLASDRSDGDVLRHGLMGSRILRDHMLHIGNRIPTRECRVPAGVYAVEHAMWIEVGPIADVIEEYRPRETNIDRIEKIDPREFRFRPDVARCLMKGLLRLEPRVRLN